MDYSFWYDVAEYGNVNWKGAFSPKEVAENAYAFLLEWQLSMANHKVNYSIDSLIELLKEDVINGSEEAKEFLDAINEQIALWKLER